MDILTALNEGKNILKSKHIESAQLDSEILMAKAIGKDRKYIILNNNKDLREKNFKDFKKLIINRSYGKPIAYLTNKKNFWKYEFYVTKDTLIPRPDTELIVEQILKVTKNKRKMNILDIGVGSGCILLSVLKERNDFYGTGIDISKNCLNISKINAISLKVNTRVKFFKSDVSA